MVHCLHKFESGDSISKFSVHLPILKTGKSGKEVVIDRKPLLQLRISFKRLSF